jgi:hypothetical protein
MAGLRNTTPRNQDFNPNTRMEINIGIGSALRKDPQPSCKYRICVKIEVFCSVMDPDPHQGDADPEHWTV